MEKTAKELIQERTYSLMSEGVRKFPAPSQAHAASASSKTTSQLSQSAQQRTLPEIQSCTLCPLSQSRTRVVVASALSKKKVFILSEHPDLADENNSSAVVYSEKSASSVIMKLIEKLELLNACHFSYALKCVPEKGIPADALSTCAQNNLFSELTAVQPEVILCFGGRALQALSYCDSSIRALELTENNSRFTLNIQGSPKTVYLLSSGLDLHTYPQWRTQVWQFLKHLKSAFY